MIHWFGEGSPHPRSLGGKGAGLDRLARLAFPVPPGFCLTTTAYHRYLGVHTLGTRIEELCARLPDESARQELAAFAHTFEFPPDLAETVRTGLETLVQREPPVGLLAVRSSAVGEDAETASFAGAHESVLGVPRDRAEEAIRSCWSSLWSARAVAYRVRKRLSFVDAAMAVVVQALIPAEVSAVVFTRNPVSGHDDEMLINATWGLGEAIVSGTVTPDTIVVDKASLRVRHVVPGEKTLQFVVQDGGGTTTIPTAGEGLALDEQALNSLGELCRRVERSFGAAVDVEAAFAGGQWYLLQARPITTGGSKP